MQKRNIGVVLLNMGGPARLEDVRPFLYNLFSDREIIRLGPALLQKPLAWLIARRRAPKSRAIYREIGGGSPITAITRAQQQALEEALAPHGPFKVVTAMRYWYPNTAQALEELAAAEVEPLIALSLYPHHSCATSGSSLNELKRHLPGQGAATLLEISSWPDHPGYLNCLAEKVKAGLARFGTEPVELLYSAHSLPTSLIEAGDPYVEHLERTIRGLEKLTGRSGRLCYQSRTGPVEWLSPGTPEMLEQLAGEGHRNVLVLPISFVSDHVETLYEIGIEYRNLAGELGLRLELTEGLNTDPLFITALRDLVLERFHRYSEASPP